jgi:mono/diheme cytochrome c family protein
MSVARWGRPLAVASLVLAALALVALAGMGFATLLRGPVPGAILRPDDPRLLATGERVYAAHCAACHGERLQGQPNWRERGPDGLLPAPPHDASGHTWHHPDAVLVEITKHGVAAAARMKDYRSAMPAYEGILSDEEIVAVLSWIKAQWPADVRRLQDEVNERHAKR